MLLSILDYELSSKVRSSRKTIRDSLLLASKQNASMILKVVMATLGVLLLVIPAVGQSFGQPPEQKPAKSENPPDADLINADRPGIADGSNVIGARRLQIETGLQEEFLAVTLNYLPTKKLNPFIDVGLQIPERTDGRSSVIFDAGVAYIIGRNLQLDASMGTGAHGDTTPHPFIEFGISFRSKVWDKARVIFRLSRQR
jgi:hypothetical protein